eukprot:SAG31_NODE_128_length_23532_cov_21.204754_4_plen_74_part_00
MATELPRQRPSVATPRRGDSVGEGGPPVVIVPGEPKAPETWANTLWDYATSYPALALVIVTLIVAQLETHNIR